MRIHSFYTPMGITAAQTASPKPKQTAGKAQAVDTLHFSASNPGSPSKPEQTPRKAYYGSRESSAVYTLNDKGDLQVAFYKEDDEDDDLLFSPENIAAQRREQAALAARREKDKEAPKDNK